MKSAQGAGAIRKDGGIVVSYFGRNYGIDSADAGFHPDDISLMEKVLILLKSFGEEPEKIVASAEALNGCRESYGDVSVRFTVLPNIDVIVVLHRGGDEFPPEANILFRDNIIENLSLEDIMRLGGLIAMKIAAISTTHL